MVDRSPLGEHHDMLGSGHAAGRGRTDDQREAPYGIQELILTVRRRKKKVAWILLHSWLQICIKIKIDL